MRRVRAGRLTRWQRSHRSFFQSFEDREDQARTREGNAGHNRAPGRDATPHSRRMTRAPLGLTLQTLARAHRARLAALLAPHGVHAGQDLLLLAIWDEPGLRQAALAARLGVEPPTVTRMVQRLERSGMIERRRDPHDARLLRIHPTPRSRLLEGTVRRAWRELDAGLIEALGESDSERLRSLAEDATRALRAVD